MTEPTPSSQYHTAADAPAPQTPTYDDLVHFAAVGRALTIWAGYAVSQRPPAFVVRLALRRQGLLTESEKRNE